MTTKELCRERGLKARRQFFEKINQSEKQVSVQSDFAQNLQKIKTILGGSQKTWAVYSSFDAEVDLSFFIENSSNIKWVYPRVVGEDLVFHEVASQRELRPGRFGIGEPAEVSPTVDVSEVDVFLVPGVAFSREGHRLGRGRGFYDRALENSSAVKVGIAYSVQIFQEVPTELNDIKMNYVVTEQEVITTDALLGEVERKVI